MKKKVTPGPKEQGVEPSSKQGSPARLKVLYHQEVLPRMMKEFSFRNPMQVPRLERIVLNVGMGEAIQNVKLLDGAVA